MRFDTAALRIINYPAPQLRKACKPVEVFDDALAALASRMLELMHAGQGIGLAAPQVGILLRFFVCNVTGDPRNDLIYINPELTDFQGSADGPEGCLSIPDVTVTVRRPLRCTMSAFDPTGKPFKIPGSDLLARCWQHETDHLDGRLIIDYMSEADKIANRRAIKSLETRQGPRKTAS